MAPLVLLVRHRAVPVVTAMLESTVSQGILVRNVSQENLPRQKVLTLALAVVLDFTPAESVMVPLHALDVP
jgi:hypothetical protein